MAEPRRIVVTAALPYANGQIHLGHCEGKFPSFPTSIWSTRFKNDDFEILLERGSNFNGHGYFLLIPIRIAEKCGIDSHFKGAQWIIQN